MAFIRTGITLVLLSLLAGCDLIAGTPDILDAAGIWRKNCDVFAGIRAHYPGPLSEPRRIPALDATDDRPEDVAFLATLRRSVPVELIQLYARAEGGADVINVVLGTSGIAVSGGIVGVIYYEAFDAEDFAGPGQRVFDRCDERALAWLETSNQRPFTDAYCRLDNNWYAYQSIT